MTRPRRTLALVGLLAILLTLFGADAASAEDRASEPHDNRASALATCYGGAQRWDAGYIDEPAGYEYIIPGPDDARDEVGQWGPVYVTSANCRDINMRLVHYPGPVTLQVCFYSPSWGCDDFRTVSGSGWHVISSNVPDGARYKVFFVASFARQIGDVAD